jgi:hypothetical protein
LPRPAQGVVRIFPSDGVGSEIYGRNEQGCDKHLVPKQRLLTVNSTIRETSFYKFSQFLEDFFKM